MKKFKKTELFGKNFFWGASTAAHQVEGGLHNQWSVWELAVANAQSKYAHEHLGQLSVWNSVKSQAQNPDNYISGAGVDHFNRYKQDFKILKKLNLNSFRFGIEWARLEPEEGKWDEEAIEHYRRYIKELKKLGIEPFCNIWHWTVPTWFEDKGGFYNRSNLKYFDAFVQKIADEYGSELEYIITLNEPNVYTSFSYVMGVWPPQEKNWLKASIVIYNLVKAHKNAYNILKRKKPRMQIGVAAQLANIQAKRPHNMWDQIMTKWMRYFWNWWFLNRISHHQDFVGFNYYFTDYYRPFRRDNPQVPVNDLGWYMEPEGLHPLLLRVWSHYRKPIIVTENGVADANDQYRKWWIEETVIAMERAMSEGVQLKGYFHWSLLDNFEWAYGWWPKFGLVEVDRQQDMKRTVRPSAEWYADFIKKINQ